MFHRKPGLIEAVSEGFSGYQLCFKKISAFQLYFRENQHRKSCDSALIFLLWKFQVSELFQRKSALFSSQSALFHKKSALIQRRFRALKNGVFSAVQSSNSAVRRLSGNEQRSIGTETFLNQSWFGLPLQPETVRERVQTYTCDKVLWTHSL